MNEKMRNELRLNAFFVVVALICVVYLVRGLVDVVETGKSLAAILADGAVSAVFGFLVSKLLSLQGLAKGEVNEQVQATLRLHGATVDSIAPYIDRLDHWCAVKNEETLRLVKSKILSAQGIAWQEYDTGLYRIVQDGHAVTVGAPQLPRAKRKAVRKADKLRLTPLSAGALTCDCNKPDDPYDFGIDKRAFERRRDLKQIVSKIACGLLFGYFGVRLITSFSWDGLIWTALQITAFLAMGAVSYMQAYFFVVDYDRHRVIRKIDNLQKFKVWSEQNENE